ncbi:MAG: hypothetical protein AAF636_18725 [Pseudomonadota bacterium]
MSTNLLPYLRDEYTYLDGSRNVQGTKNHKDFQVIGTDDANFLTMSNAGKRNADDPGNVNIFYDGMGGNDYLRFNAAEKGITLTAFGPNSEWDFYSTGGTGNRANNSDYGYNLSSLEIWARSVENIQATHEDDFINLSAAYDAYAVSGQSGKDVIIGSMVNDTIDGGSGKDTINGHGGDDSIVGGSGDDALYGGEGADTFVFSHGDDDDVLGDLESIDILSFGGVTLGDISLSYEGGNTVLHYGNDSVTLEGIGYVNMTNFTFNQIHYSHGSTTTQLTWNGTVSSLTDLEAAQYIASYPDLIAAFGTNLEAAKNHFFVNGIAEGREIAFNSEQYLANYGDLQNEFQGNLLSATLHFITNGVHEGRTDNVNITDNLLSASVSSQWDGNHGIDKVLDGDDSTFNHTAWGDHGASMTFAFSQDFALDEINIVNRHDGSAHHQVIVGNRLNGATVEAYDDGSLVWSGTLNAATYQDLHLGGVVADTVVINAAGHNYLHIAEVDIWGDHVF